MAKASSLQKNQLKDRIIAAIRDDETDSMDVGNVCLAIAAAMMKANQVPESHFIDNAGIYYRGQEKLAPKN